MIRTFRYSSDQEGIMMRYLRESSNWKNHLDNCHNFILNAVRKRTGESLAVLGSGWLLDLPLEELRKHFTTIYLVDIRHPAQVRKKVRDMEGVHLVEEDLNGGLAGALRKKTHVDIGELLKTYESEEPLKGLAIDFFISLNLLNQLDILVCDHLKEKHGKSEAELLPLRRFIQERHVSWLRNKPTCLISDVLEENSVLAGPAGRKEAVIKASGVSTSNLLHTKLPPGHNSAEWWWDFDSLGHYRQGQRTRLRVRALNWG